MSLQRGEYVDSVNLVAVLMLTVRKAAGDGKAEEMRIMESMKNEIIRLKQMNVTKMDHKRNIEFVEMSRQITSFLNIDENLIKEIIALDDRNTTSRVKRTIIGDNDDQSDLNHVISHMINILTLSGNPAHVLNDLTYVRFPFSFKLSSGKNFIFVWHFNL